MSAVTTDNGTNDDGTRVILPIATGPQTWARARGLLKQRRGLMVAAAATLLVASATALAIPALLAAIVQLANNELGSSAGSTSTDPAQAGATISRWLADLTERTSATTVLVGLAVAVVLAAVSTAALGALSRSLIARVTESALAELREEVVGTVLQLPSSQLENAGSGDVVSRVTGDVETVSTAASQALPTALTATFGIAVTVAGLGVLDWRFAVAALATLPLQIFALRRFRRDAPPVYRAVREAQGERAEAVMQAVEGAPTVLALRSQGDHERAVERTSREAIRREMLGVRNIARFYNGLNLAELCGLAAILAVAFWLVQADLATVGAATAAAMFFHQLFGPMMLLLGEVDDLALAGAGLARLVGVTSLATPTTAQHPAAAVPAAGDPAAVPAPAVPVTLGHVTFAHRPGQDVVRDVTLTLAPGERVAVVGTSGAGKSTLARLVLGTLRPDTGRAEIDGVAADVLLREAPGRVVLVDQDVHVFTGPLREDLLLARPGADDDVLLAALDAVGAAWVTELADGLATRLGPDGLTLRGDQAQQVALARVLLARPQVVVLDEATADAPRAQQEAVARAVGAVTAGRTSLVVAHRLDQAIAADRIVVMEHGRVVQEGTPDALLAQPGPFATLWDAWAGRG